MKKIPSLFLTSLKLMASRGNHTAWLFLIAFVVSHPAEAATIGVTYSFTGGPIAPPVQSGNTLALEGLFTGSVLSGNPAQNAVWNPVTYADHSVVDLTTGLLNGTFIMTFGNGDTLSGTLFEDVTAVVANGGTGPFTQTFTFTGGTGKFAGATGSASGQGLDDKVSGSGTINAPAIAPEPASFALIVGGLLSMAGSRRLVRRNPFRLRP